MLQVYKSASDVLNQPIASEVVVNTSDASASLLTDQENF